MAARVREKRRYEERECRRCFRGRVHADATSVRTVPCAECGGAGRVCVYLYPPPRQKAGRP